MVERPKTETLVLKTVMSLQIIYQSPLKALMKGTHQPGRNQFLYGKLQLKSAEGVLAMKIMEHFLPHPNYNPNPMFRGPATKSHKTKVQGLSLLNRWNSATLRIPLLVLFHLAETRSIRIRWLCLLGFQSSNLLRQLLHLVELVSSYILPKLNH